jgi:hypothetical protein
MRDVHVDPDLSAYLDDELVPADRERVETHLTACDRCSRRLAELRATASLMATLPYARASRSLVPVVSARWTWLRPVRSFSMFASGAFVFIFLLTAVARTGTGLSGSGAPAAAQPAVARSLGIGAGSAPQPTAAELGGTAAPAPAAQAPAPTPAPATFGAFAPAQDQTRSTAATAAPSALTDAQKRVDLASPTVAIAPQSSQEGVLRVSGGPKQGYLLLEPLLWILLAIVAAVIAILAHLRLRAA